MYNYRILVFLVVSILLGACGKKSDIVGNEKSKKPNVLFIAVDDLRPELGCYGNPIVQTPNMDELAQTGTLFSRAYCNIPVCGASRASILTGTRPTNYRFLNHRARADVDNPEVPILPEVFKDKGYYTISLGKVFHFKEDSEDAWNENWRPGMDRNYYLPKNQVLDRGTAGGGDPYECVDVPDTAYYDGQIAQRAISYLKRFSDTDSSFFLAVGFRKPHLPFNAPKKYWDLYDPKDIGIAPNSFPSQDAPDEAFHNWGELRKYNQVPKDANVPDELALTMRHAYYACASYVDAQIGFLLDALEETGLKENTIIVLWGDHGWNLGENAIWGKFCNFNRSLNAPLIFNAPGVTHGGTCENITEFIDIYPSICELAGIQKPHHLDGESLVERMKNPQRKEADYAVCKRENGVTYIEGDYFYTEWYDENDQPITDMLYDHSIDPEENRNVSGHPEYLDLAARFSQEIRKKRGDEFFKDTSK